MYARVSTIQGAPGKVDDVTRQTQEQTLPQLQKLEGFKGFVVLGDRQSGKMLGVSFWESGNVGQTSAIDFTCLSRTGNIEQRLETPLL